MPASIRSPNPHTGTSKVQTENGQPTPEIMPGTPDPSKPLVPGRKPSHSKEIRALATRLTDERLKQSGAELYANRTASRGTYAAWLRWKNKYDEILAEIVANPAAAAASPETADPSNLSAQASTLTTKLTEAVDIFAKFLVDVDRAITTARPSPFDLPDPALFSKRRATRIINEAKRATHKAEALAKLEADQTRAAALAKSEAADRAAQRSHEAAAISKIEAALRAAEAKIASVNSTLSAPTGPVARHTAADRMSHRLSASIAKLEAALASANRPLPAEVRPTPPATPTFADIAAEVSDFRRHIREVSQHGA